VRKLHRSRKSKVLGGVAAGFAEYFGTDVTVMRLIFALLAVVVPNVILAYILAWIIIPEEPAEVPETSVHSKQGCEVGLEGKLPPTADEVLRAKQGDALSTPQSGRPDLGQPPAGGSPQASGAGAPKDSVAPDRNRQLLGYILVLVGAIVLAKRFIPDFLWRLPSRLLWQFWPVLVILAGAALIFGAIRGR